jgi:microcystin-dependent protein
MDNFIGEIRIFPYNQIPKGWLACNGQLLPLNQNQALFSLLGVYYGGDGRTNFNLPDLRGRAIVGMGTSPKTQTPYTIGRAQGTETVQLNSTQLPLHTHNVMALNSTADSLLNAVPPVETIANPVIKPVTGLAVNAFSSSLASPTTLPADTVVTAGQGAGHENRMPLLALIPCIATQGVYPSRQ